MQQLPQQWTNFHKFSLLNSERMFGGSLNKITTSTQICCRTTLRNVSGQLYRFTAQLIQFKVMQRQQVFRRDAISLLSTRINLPHVFKMSAFVTYLCFEWCTPTVNGFVDFVRCSMLSESRVTWATSVPILVFRGLSVLALGPMYATDRRQTSDSIIA